MAEAQRLPVRQKLLLLARIWTSYARVLLTSSRPLPEQVKLLKGRPINTSAVVSPHKLGRAIHRGLRVGPLSPRCLPKALVMFDLLRRQGSVPELVIGLPEEARSHRAHAWVELDSLDVGPPPGRSGHHEMVRYS